MSNAYIALKKLQAYGKIKNVLTFVASYLHGLELDGLAGTQLQSPSGVSRFAQLFVDRVKQDQGDLYSYAARAVRIYH